MEGKIIQMQKNTPTHLISISPGDRHTSTTSTPLGERLHLYSALLRSMTVTMTAMMTVMMTVTVTE